MCGICGIYAIGRERPVAPERVEAMRDSLGHRGPDDTGSHVRGPIGLGATRLAIIDVERGHQPACNEDGTVWAVLNGEIYNHRALRRDLEAQGHRFASRGDTEVLAHLFEEHGPGFVEHLRGMFALALWDEKSGRLLLARDRLGIKPLVYAEHEGELLFGSEIKALLRGGVKRELDAAALHDYLTFDYVPGTRSMFAGVRKLPAGHMIVVDRDGEVRPRPYWEFPPQPDTQPDTRPDPRRNPRPVPELRSELESRLDDAVHATMVSDVPIGAFLSGGLDSSVVTALMARHSSAPVRTYSIGFREQSYNELPYARRVSRHLGTEHHELTIEPLVVDVVHSLVEAFDEPFADSSAVAGYLVSEAAAAHTKVVLSGDGGDEVFGGYVIYQADRLAALYRRLPRAVSQTLLPSLVGLLPASDSKMSWDLKLRRFVAHAARDPVTAHASWRVIFTEDMKARLYAEPSSASPPGFAPATHDSLDLLRGYHESYPGADALNRFMYVDSKVSLVDDMLTKVDRTSMASSLEVRVPLLDHQLVEWMAGVSSRYKVRRLELKWLLKQVALELLPRDIVMRPKAGFHVPVPVWLKSELRPLVEDVLSPATIARQGVFEPDYVSRLVAEHASGRRDHSRNLWGLLMFGLWFDRHLA
ncbi:MAG: asparagine synthase (glutamine-hydrolyzing) [Anaerolineae bacterium]